MLSISFHTSPLITKSILYRSTRGSTRSIEMHVASGGIGNHAIEIKFPKSLVDNIAHRVLEKAIDPRHPAVNSERYSNDLANCIKNSIDPELEDLLAQVSASAPDVILLKNFPVDKHVPRTGTISERVKSKGRVAEAAILGIGRLLGYKSVREYIENEGEIVNDVAITAKEASAATGRGGKSIPYHVDMAFTENPPDALLLVGLEGDPKVFTSIVHVDDVLQAAGPDVVEALVQPHYGLRKLPGVDRNAIGQVENTFALLSADKRTGKQRMRWYSDHTKVVPLTPEAHEAYGIVRHHVAMLPDHDITLKYGEALLFRNGLGHPNKPGGVLHKRKGDVSNKYRWLIRGYLNELRIGNQHT